MHLATGEQLKREGQALATDHAGDKWTTVALAHLRLFIAAQKDEDGNALPFTFDGFRQWAIDCGMSEPVSVNAWGALPRAAMCAGLCLPTGQFAKAGRVQAHARMLRMWRAI